MCGWICVKEIEIKIFLIKNAEKSIKEKSGILLSETQNWSVVFRRAIRSTTF